MFGDWDSFGSGVPGGGKSLISSHLRFHFARMGFIMIDSAKRAEPSGDAPRMACD